MSGCGRWTPWGSRARTPARSPRPTAYTWTSIWPSPGMPPRHDVGAAEVLTAGDHDAGGAPVVGDPLVDPDPDRPGRGEPARPVGGDADHDHVHREQLPIVGDHT